MIQNKIPQKDKTILIGISAGVGLLVFYLSIISIFQGIDFAFVNLRSLWYLIFPLTIGFGTQMGLYASISHTARLTGAVVSSGAVSGGSMIACCSHFLLNIIPLAGAGSLAIFVMKYQPAFLSAGILSNFIGISFMVNHRKKMKGAVL